MFYQGIDKNSTAGSITMDNFQKLEQEMLNLDKLLKLEKEYIDL